MNKRIAAAVFSASALGASAGDFSNVGSLAQDEFRGLSRDLGAAFSYKGITPATPLGALGFDAGIEVTDTKLQNASAFARAGAGSDSHIVVPKLHVHKGLPGGFDVGAFVGGTSQIGAALFGADLRYAPTFATRCSMTGSPHPRWPRAFRARAPRAWEICA